jgi:hypothetical protein
MKPAQAAAAPAADGSAPPNCAPMGSFSWSLLDNEGNLVDGTRPSSAAGATAAAAEGGSSSSKAPTGVPAAGAPGTVSAPTATSSPAPSAAKAHDTRARSGTAESLAAASPATAPAPATVPAAAGLAPLPTASDSTVAAAVGGDLSSSSSSSSAHPSLFSPPGPGTEALLPPAAAVGGLPNSIINTIAPPMSAPIDDPLAGALWAAPQLAPESLISPQGRAGVQQQPRPAGNTGRAAQRRERRPSALARESDDGADLEGICYNIISCYRKLALSWTLRSNRLPLSCS